MTASLSWDTSIEGSIEHFFYIKNYFSNLLSHLLVIKGSLKNEIKKINKKIPHFNELLQCNVVLTVAVTTI